MSRVDRIDGLTGSIAVKAPVKVATTANITLSGAQTIDGVALTADESPRQRVLVKDQTSDVDNGIYDVNSGAWTRSPDFDGLRDAVDGTQVIVNEGTTAIPSYYLSATNPVDIGTDSLTFVAYADSAASSAGAAASSAAAAVVSAAAAATSATAALLVGEVKIWSGTIAGIPSGWLHCNGQAVSRSTYSDLFAAISTTHGVGDGSTTFNLPPSGRHIIGAEGDSGETYDSGDTGGSNTIASANLPTHTHDDGTLASDTESDHAHTGFDTQGFTSSSTGGNAVGRAGDSGDAGEHSHDITGDTGDGGFANTDFELPYVVMPLIIKY